MVPHSYIGVEDFPASTSGKLDRKTLLGRVESISFEEHSGLISAGEIVEDAPDASQLSDNEILLRDTCSDVLNLPPSRIIMNRSFLSLGGDSITAMQALSMMRQRGDKRVSIKDLLTSPSLSGVASKMSAVETNNVRIPIIDELKRVSLSPMQLFFMDVASSSSGQNHYNQNVLLRLNDSRDPQRVEKAIAGVIKRHPILRARFEKQADGKWMQYIVPDSQSSFKLQYFSSANSLEKRAEMMLRARTSLNLTEGPLLRAQLFKDGSQEMILFIVVHHIVVDLVSWRVIVEELESSLTGSLSAPPLQGEIVPFPVLDRASTPS